MQQDSSHNMYSLPDTENDAEHPDPTTRKPPTANHDALEPLCCCSSDVPARKAARPVNLVCWHSIIIFACSNGEAHYCTGAAAGRYRHILFGQCQQ